jgi:hypothetical protein
LKPLDTEYLIFEVPTALQQRRPLFPVLGHAYDGLLKKVVMIFQFLKGYLDLITKIVLKLYKILKIF